MQRFPHSFRGFSFRFVSLLCLSSLFLLVGCGGGSISSNTGGTGGGNALPTPDHVIVIVLENHSFSEVIGSPSMPYLNSLAGAHSLAANYFADIHPSIGNYFMLTTGQLESVDDAFTGTVTDDNIVRAMNGAGKSWKAYMESIPSAGYLGGDVVPYLKHHDPFSYFSDVTSNTTQAANIVPFTQLQADIAANTLPNFLFITPQLA